MKFVLLSISAKKESWLEEAKQVFADKIQKLMPFQIEELKSPKLDREDAGKKIKAEAEIFSAYLKPDDYVILFDEKGQSLSSQQFARFVEQQMGSGKKRLVFIIGGAFGVDQLVKTRANKCLTMGPFTLNHRVAELVSLEQIYRGLTIIKGLPYHNE